MNEVVEKLAEELGITAAEANALLSDEERNEIAESSSERNIGDIGTPDVVWVARHHIPEQIGVCRMQWMRRTRLGLWVRCFKPHYGHQTAYAVATRYQTKPVKQFRYHTSASVEWQVGIDAVHRLHHLCVRT